MKFFVVIDIRAIKQRASFNEVNPLFGCFLVTQEDSPQNKKEAYCLSHQKRTLGGVPLNASHQYEKLRHFYHMGIRQFSQSGKRYYEKRRWQPRSNP